MQIEIRGDTRLDSQTSPQQIAISGLIRQEVNIISIDEVSILVTTYADTNCSKIQLIAQEKIAGARTHPWLTPEDVMKLEDRRVDDPEPKSKPW